MTTDSITTSNSEVSMNTPVCGFFRRILAILIDGAVLAGLGFGIGYFFGNLLIGSGWWGRLIGLLVALLYFGVFNSFVFKGQTLGKQVAGIKVVKSDGKYLGLFQSLIRAFILVLPFFLTGVQAPASIASMTAYTLTVGVIIFGVGSSTVYLYLFNRLTRQSLHDLASGSYVVKATVDEPLQTQGVWRIHLGVVGGLFVAAAILLIWSVINISKGETLARVFDIQNTVMEQNEIDYAKVNIGSTPSATSQTTFVAIQANVGTWPSDPEGLIDRIAKSVLEKYPFIYENDSLQIRLSRGYDLGIGWNWHNLLRSRSPHEWDSKIASTVSLF